MVFSSYVYKIAWKIESFHHLFMDTHLLCDDAVGWSVHLFLSHYSCSNKFIPFANSQAYMKKRLLIHTYKWIVLQWIYIYCQGWTKEWFLRRPMRLQEKKMKVSFNFSCGQELGFLNFLAAVFPMPRVNLAIEQQKNVSKKLEIICFPIYIVELYRSYIYF